MRAAWVAMAVTGWFVIVPLALAALLTGLVMSVGTAWGVFRRNPVVMSCLLNLLSAVVLLSHMPTVSAMADVAPGSDSMSLSAPGGDLLHPGIGPVVLLVITVLNVFKPRGMTPSGFESSRRRGASR